MTLQAIDRTASAEKAAQRLDALMSEIHPSARDYVANAVPESMRRTFAEAFSGSSRAQAIKSKCLSCANFQREEVRMCPVVTCPLHSVRPYQHGEQDQKDAESE